MLNHLWPYILEFLRKNREATLQEIGNHIRTDENLSNVSDFEIERELRKRRGYFTYLPSGKWVINKRYLKEVEIENTIVQILEEGKGRADTTDQITDKKISDEVADRMGITHEERRHLTRGGDNQWYKRIGYARKNLERRYIITPTSASGRGVWKLMEEGMKSNLYDRK